MPPYLEGNTPPFTFEKPPFENIDIHDQNNSKNTLVAPYL
jgi:hypothetical protein